MTCNTSHPILLNAGAGIIVAAALFGTGCLLGATAISCSSVALGALMAAPFILSSFPTLGLAHLANEDAIDIKNARLFTAALSMTLGTTIAVAAFAAGYIPLTAAILVFSVGAGYAAVHIISCLIKS